MALEKQTQVFISYSHKDKRWLEVLLTNLRPYERDDAIVFKAWTDKQIQPGQVWRDQIHDALMQSSLAILLVTQEFLASEFIAGKELPPLLSLAETDGVQILWVAVSDSTVADTVISEYQSLNNPDKPLDRIPKPQRNGELARIAKKIHAMACECRKGEAPLGDPASASSPQSIPKIPLVNESWIGQIRPIRSFFRKHNFDAFPELKDYIDQNRVQTATLIQMSCLNEMHVVRQLWRTNAKIELYVSSANEHFGVTSWQRDRVNRFLQELPNELQNIPDAGASGQINIYKYDAPASIRAVLIDDRILTSGHYLYQKHTLEDHGKLLDVRGGELPLMLLRKQDPDFEILQGMILRLIENWQTEGVVEPFKTYRHGDFLGQSKQPS